jgi:tRNA (guanine-N7-)-methyltransferase
VHPLSFYGRRVGRGFTEQKSGLFESLLPHYVFTPAMLPAHAFAETWLEIGFGGGEHLFHLAKHHPEALLIGAEAFRNGVSSLLEKIADDSTVSNIRIFPDDIRLLLPQLPDGCLERVYLLFPDPWPKARHHKRRLLNHAFLDEISRLLKIGGYVQLATDHPDYSVWMLEHLQQRLDFEWDATCAADWENPPTPWVTTRYEHKARSEGRKPIFLKFMRI